MLKSWFSQFIWSLSFHIIIPVPAILVVFSFVDVAGIGVGVADCGNSGIVRVTMLIGLFGYVLVSWVSHMHINEIEIYGNTCFIT